MHSFFYFSISDQQHFLIWKCMKKEISSSPAREGDDHGSMSSGPGKKTNVKCLASENTRLKSVSWYSYKDGLAATACAGGQMVTNLNVKNLTGDKYIVIRMWFEKSVQHTFLLLLIFLSAWSKKKQLRYIWYHLPSGFVTNERTWKERQMKK